MSVLINTTLDRYREKLANLPPSGGGGCHTALLGAASLGFRAGVSRDEIFADLREHIHGKRTVPDKEIQDAIEKAAADHAAGRKAPARPSAPVFEAQKALKKIIEAGCGIGEAEIVERSPVRIDWEREEDAVRVIAALYQPEEYVFIGRGKERPQIGCEIRTSKEWIQFLGDKGPESTAPHIIPNPLTGKPAPKSSGDGETLRGDACVASFRYAVVEFDDIPREDQLAFWWGVQLPVVALIDSGNKSIHGWIRIHEVDTGTEWARVVEQHLFGMLVPLGVDSACKNEARLSRLPGHKRNETGRWQRLLYLAPEGKAVAS